MNSDAGDDPPTRASWGGDHGLSFSRDDVLGIGTLPLAVFAVGRGQTCTSLVWGSWKGIQVFAWDLLYWEFFPDMIGTIGYQVPYQLSCAMARLPRACPRTVLAPAQRGATFARKVAKTFRLARVELPPPVGEEWTLYAADPAFGDLLGRSPLQHRLRVHERFGMEIAEDAIVVYGNQADTTALGYLLDTVINLRTQILPAVDQIPN